MVAFHIALLLLLLAGVSASKAPGEIISNYDVYIRNLLVAWDGIIHITLKGWIQDLLRGRTTANAEREPITEICMGAEPPEGCIGRALGGT